MALRLRAGRNCERVGILSIVLKEGDYMGEHKNKIIVVVGIFSIIISFPPC